ncbi:hypothetical protein AA0Y32_03565 [Georgenia phoenicis]|uniref:hypothetical protein n=1 Tax=unclassified Georgenia TaxID=2626815 RepID=UPI0039AEAFC8
MSTNRPRTPLPELAGAVAVGVALAALTLAVLLTLHVATDRLLPTSGATGAENDATQLRVPSHEMDPTRVP